MPCLGRRAAAILWLALACVTAALASETPALTGRVVDTAQMLSPAARARIDAALTAHENKTTNQIVLLTVPDIGSGSIEDYAQGVFTTWKLGVKGRDNGVLVLIATRDRQLRIHVGYGLEGVLPDAVASRVVRDVIGPRFTANDFDGGTEEGVKAIVARLEGQGGPVADPATARKPGFWALADRIADNVIYHLAGLIFFLLLAWYTYVKATSPKGWLAYVVLAPLWWVMAAALAGPHFATAAAAVFIVAYPTTKLMVRRTKWYKRINALRAEEAKTLGGSSGGGSSGGWSSSSESSSSSDSYAGKGGDSGGGGASGRW